MDPASLKTFLDKLVADPSLRPIYSKEGILLKTFCNMGARRSADLFLCTEFNDMNLLADDMFKVMQTGSSGKWGKVTGETAASWANAGRLAFAALPGVTLKEAHGHITVIYPAPMQFSGSLNCNVPMCANIGKGDNSSLVDRGDGNLTKPNWVCKISQAFPVSTGEPDYFVYLS